MPASSEGPTSGSGVPVSKHRLDICLSSASFWVDELPKYADTKQRWADFWALAAGTLAAITSLAIWPILTDQSSALVKAVVSAAALLAAVFALVPRVKQFGELAGQARELSSRYGELKGVLIDLVAATNVDQVAARDVVSRFQATKEKKDSLRGLPDRAGRERAAALRTHATARKQARAGSTLSEANPSEVVAGRPEK